MHPPLVDGYVKVKFHPTNVFSFWYCEIAQEKGITRVGWLGIQGYASASTFVTVYCYTRDPVLEVTLFIIRLLLCLWFRSRIHRSR